MTALQSYEAFARAWRAVAPPETRCHLCAHPLPDDHEHVLDLRRRWLACACGACAESCTRERNRRFKAVPHRVLLDPAFAFDEERWAALGIPTRLACVVFSSQLGRWVALHPCAAGVAEAPLAREAWGELVASSALIGAVRRDVEAVLVYRRRDERRECFLVPIDVCHLLARRAHLRWRGVDGGDRAWSEIDSFFAELRARARSVTGASMDAIQGDA